MEGSSPSRGGLIAHQGTRHDVLENGEGMEAKSAGEKSRDLFFRGSPGVAPKKSTRHIGFAPSMQKSLKYQGFS